MSQPAAGFYTEEVRDSKAGGRRGFDVVALDGRRGPLARVAGPGPRVGKYAVNLRSFEDIGVGALEAGLQEPHRLLVLDELGKMEFLSDAFVILVEQVFRGPHPLLGTILYRRHPLGDHFRRAPGVELIQVTTENRDTLPRKLARSLSETVVGPREE